MALRQLTRRSMACVFPASSEFEAADPWFRSQTEEAIRIPFEYLEGWHRPPRRHCALDHHSPIQYKTRHPLAAWFLSAHPSATPGKTEKRKTTDFLGTRPSP